MSRTEPQKVGMIALGCPKNLVDAELMMGSLIQQGYIITPHPEEADVLIVNTCSFIGEARRESLEAIQEATAWKRKGRCQRVVVTGCLPQLLGEALLQDLPGVDAVLGVGEIHRLPQLLAALDGEGRAVVEEPKAPYPESLPRLLATPPWSAYLKIAEGCDLKCTFCIIPRIRGPFRSRPPEAIVAEAQRLARQGVREVILVAEDTTYYGHDLAGRPLLVELLKSLSAIEGLAWIRLLYTYPARIDEELIEAMSSLPKVCAYLDVPFQHGDDEILRRMGRQGRREEYLALVRRLREALPDIALRSTFILGFPGEGRNHFRRLLSFLEEAQLEWVGFFRYSREPWAPSSRFPGQVPSRIVERRLEEACALQQRIALERQRRWLGRILPVLVEAAPPREGGLWRGRSPREAPEIDGHVEFSSSTPLALGSIVPVCIEKATPWVLRGSLCDEALHSGGEKPWWSASRF